MTFFGACVVGALTLALVMALVTFVAVEAVSADVAVFATHDYKRAICAEREGQRMLRVRYARGDISAEDYRRLCYELEHGRPVTR